VSLNGSPVLSRFDVAAAAGGKDKAIVREFDAWPNPGGQFVIQFSAMVDSPTVSGLEIARAPDLAPPVLHITRSGSSTELFWPGTATAFNLYVADSLEPPIAWTPLTNPPTSMSNQLRVTLPLHEGTRFFRLSAP
jgi:hypothetical protein